MLFMLMMFALWLAFGPWRRHRRYWRHSRRAHSYCGGAGVQFGDYRATRALRRPTLADSERWMGPPARVRESRYEGLKRRYVSGELSDAAYEREIDDLLRRPGGMQEVS